MAKQRSAKGEVVDFDLMRIKRQFATAPKTVDVQNREEFINKKLKRKTRKAKAAISNLVSKNSPAEVVEPVEAVPEKAPVAKKTRKPKKTPAKD